MLTFNRLGTYGQFGNQLFQVASTIGIATKQGYDYGFPYWPEGDCFRYRLPVVRVPMFSNPPFPTKQVEWGYRNVQCTDNVSLFGYMQSEKYFKHCEPIIRYYFSFVDKPHAIHCDATALHMRLGPGYGDSKHPFCSKKYYEDAIEYLGATHIYVFSDDPARAKEIFPYFKHIHNDDYRTDLYLMTECRYHIIANSSFSWWGAWLARSEQVVAPREWFGPDLDLDTKDIYCEGWKVI